MITYLLSKTDDFQKKAVIKRLKILIPKYKIRQSQTYIRSLTGKQDLYSLSPEKKDNSMSNFIIRKKLLNRCHQKRDQLRNNLIGVFFKSIINNYKERLRNCLFILSSQRIDSLEYDKYDSIDKELYHEDDHLEDENQYGFEEQKEDHINEEDDQYEFDENDEDYEGEYDNDGEYIDDNDDSEGDYQENYNQEFYEEEMRKDEIDIGMSKIEETFEESIDDSRLDSPTRKLIKNPNLLIDSQAFNLKLSKIQQAGEEHNFIDTGNFNFTTHETGNFFI